jgi:hypothetical protein
MDTAGTPVTKESSPSKKRAIDTMLADDPQKDDGPPPLPKRQTPPNPARHKPALPLSFLDHALSPEDATRDRAQALLDGFRLDRGLADSDPIPVLFDRWVREIEPDGILVVDALFDLLLSGAQPDDDPLVARVPLLMNQILQRRCLFFPQG